MEHLVALLGWPVAHSLSPAMHNEAFKALKLPWRYLPFAIPPTPSTSLKEAVMALRALGFRGANVTVPHKEAVPPYLDALDDSARAIGAVNTIVCDEQGRFIGHNTDALGFMRDLAAKEIAGMKEVLVLGAGGAARAVIFGLLNEGYQQLTIVNRTKAKADELAAAFKQDFAGATIKTASFSKEALCALSQADLVINTTSVGLSSDSEMPWDEDVAFKSHQRVYDLIYRPALTPLMRHAQKGGAEAFNGLGMLIHQGALAFEIWTGHQAPLEVMEQAALRALEAKA